MLLKKLSLATLACLFASGCIISEADDDGTGTEGATTTPTTVTPTSGTPTTTEGSSTTTEETTGEDAAGCGWGPIPGNEDVPNGYQCGIEDGTVDPDGTFPIECSANAILELGTECLAAGVTAEGCCDANGDVWFCIDPDGDGPEEPVVGGSDCGDPTGTGTDTDTDTGTDTDATATDSATDGDTDTDTDTDTDSTTTTTGTTTGK